MRKYADSDEQTIRAEKLVGEWTRSGLLGVQQSERIRPELKTDLRRTNFFLRAVLFGFGILIIAASVLFVGSLLSLRNDGAISTICFMGAIGWYAAAEGLVNGFRLYRFGIEEAAAMGAVALLGSGAFFSAQSSFGRGDIPAFAGLVAASGAALAVYFRFGYVYAAAASMLCLSLAPFQTDASEGVRRLMSAAVLLGFFFLARRQRLQHGDEFPGDEYGVIQALAWGGIYAYLNLKAIPQVFSGGSPATSFYWFTYAMTWVLPLFGLTLAIRHKDRPLLDVSLLMALATLATNKPYLGLPRQTWDPILFGLLLGGIVFVLRRWLAKGQGNGFTAARILNSDKHKVSVLGTAAGLLQNLPGPHPDSPAAKPFEPGGGRSGGAGASGSF